MVRVSRRPSWLRVVGVVICAVALLMVAGPVVGYARVALSDDEVPLSVSGGSRRVSLPADETWGVYINDANNSGYSLDCFAVEASGQQVPLRDPWWTVSGSETEMLDFVFDTGSGELTFTCRVPGEEVTLRPVPNLKAVVLGVLAGGLLGLLGLALALNWAFTRTSARSPEPWSQWPGGPVPFPTSGGTYTVTEPRPRRRSGKKVAGVVVIAAVLAVGLIAAAGLAWKAAMDRIAEEIAGEFPDAGEYYEVRGTGDAALIAGGDQFLADVGAPPGAVRDPYGSTCWVIGVSLCMTSEDLDAEELLDATSAQLRDRGAKLEKRWCFIDQCYAYLTYQRAPLMLVVDVPDNLRQQRALVTGAVVTNEELAATLESPGAPLASWASLSATPPSWQAPECVQREAGGCRQYDGDFAGSASTAAAVDTLRRMLTASGYAFNVDTCPPTGPVEASCTIDVRRFRTMGSLDGVILQFRISPGERRGFSVTMKGEPYPN